MNQDGKRAVGAIGALCLLGLFWAVVGGQGYEPRRDAPSPAASRPKTYELPAEAIAPEPWKNPDTWTYDVQADPISATPIKTACTNSINQAQLSPPYEPVTAMLCLRHSKRGGTDAFVSLNGKGQILCATYNGCTLYARFDNRQVVFGGRGAADYSTNIVFLVPASKLASDLKKTEHTKIEITFYEAGTQTLEFDTKGLVWK
jgi:hypothetical protein